jgi:23S rRNA (uracil1939-C5)-methyltransferase
VTFFHENLEEDVSRQAWAQHGFDKVLLTGASRRAGRDAAHYKTGARSRGLCFL